MNFAKSLLRKLALFSVIAVMVTVTFFSSPLTSPALAQEDGYVFKINVSSIESAVEFYEGVLGMERDTSRDTDRWTEFIFDFVTPKTVIGTYVDSATGTGEAALTFVVPDIEGARIYLEGQGVEVSPVIDAGAGVLLAFFEDFDGNKLALRQNLPL